MSKRPLHRLLARSLPFFIELACATVHGHPGRGVSLRYRSPLRVDLVIEAHPDHGPEKLFRITVDTEKMAVISDSVYVLPGGELLK